MLCHMFIILEVDSITTVFALKMAEGIYHTLLQWTLNSLLPTARFNVFC